MESQSPPIAGMFLEKLLRYCLHGLIYEVEIGLARDPFMTPAEVFGIL